MIYGLYKVIYFLMKRTASIKKETELRPPGHYIVHANDFKKKNNWKASYGLQVIS